MFWKTGVPRWARRCTGRGGTHLETSYSRENEISMLREETEMLEEDLKAIERRMLDLESEKKKDIS